MKFTRRRVRLLSLLVFAVSCWLLAADAPATAFTVSAAMVSFLFLVGSFASPPDRVGYDLPELMRDYRLTEADVLSAGVMDGYLFVDEAMIAFMPARQREPSWSVPLESVTWVEFDSSGLFPHIAVRYEDASDEDHRKRFNVGYSEYSAEEDVRTIEAWIEHVRRRVGSPLPTLGLR